MRKRRWIVLILIVLALLLVGIFLLRPREPVYQGKRLNAWVRDLPWTLPGFAFGNPSSHSHVTMTLVHHSIIESFSVAFTNITGSSSSNSNVAFEAIRKMGTNSLPVLLEMLRARDSAVRLAVMSVLARQRIIRVPFTLAVQRRHQALSAIVALGPAATPAVPALLQMAQDKDRSISEAASFALNQIGPDAASKAGVK